MRQSSELRPAAFHPKAREAIQSFGREARIALGQSIFDLQRGIQLGLPLSKPMPTIAPGAGELRVRDAAGIYRAFYYVKSARGVLIFHAFQKKTQKTPPQELEVARKRLIEMGDLT